MSTTPEAPRAEFQLVPPALAKAGAWSWRILVVATVVALGAFIFFQLRVVTVPIFLAILASTLLVPVANFLERKGLRRSLATALVFMGVFALLAALAYVLAAP